MGSAHDKFIGLALAMLSSVATGSSYVITKKSLIQSSDRHGFDGSGIQYIKNPLWWCGTLTLVSGELMNTAAYAFAPAVLVTPMGAMSVLIGAILGAYFLEEHLNTVGRLGCATCLLGSILIVLHAPADPELTTIDQILNLATQPLFLLYLAFVLAFTIYAIYRLAPRSGSTNPIIYISICSLVGSLSVMSIKAFSIAVKLTIAGDNQFTSASTYVFLIAVVITTITQTHYLNKAMSHFPASLVNAIFYVGFTTCTLSASFIFYKGINTDDVTNIFSIVCGFLLDFTGVAVLTLSKKEENAIHRQKADYRPLDEADDEAFELQGTATRSN